MNKSSSLQFVDTNILIYAHDISAGQKHFRAPDLVRELWQSGEGCLSIQVLQDFYVNVTQKVTRPMPPDTAARIVADLAVWQTHRPGGWKGGIRGALRTPSQSIQLRWARPQSVKS
jgi:hypothetical protein